MVRVDIFAFLLTLNCCCSIAKLGPILCNPMNWSTPGFIVLHYLLEFAQTHVHWVGDSIQPSHPLLPSSPLALNLSQHQGLFQWVSSLHLEKAMGPHSSTLAWKIPWMEEPGRLQSMGLQRVRHNWLTSLSLFTFMHWRRKRQPTPVFLLENPRDGGAWWAAVYGVARTWIRLKWLSSSSSSSCLHQMANLLDLQL